MPPITPSENSDSQIRIITPQFEREPGAPAPVEVTTETFDTIRTLTGPQLKALGMRPWGKVNGGEVDECLYLFPGEWYSKIPAGFQFVDIFGEKEAFVPSKTDDDIRFGCLAYGVVVKETP